MLPCELLRLKLHDARCYGYPFDAVWADAAVSCARTAEDPSGWVVAFDWARESWRRAFEGLPASAVDEAAAVLGVGRAASDDGWGRRRCENRECGAWLATDRDPRAKYCDDRCRRAANYQRERLLAAR
jgi:hypothetical protein